MDVRQTVTLWQNAQRILRDPGKKQMHEQARSVITAIYADWSSRATRPSTEPFNWPMTEAACGNGTLATECWEPEGLLKYMGYRVGLGASSSRQARESVLAGIFECVVPPVFERSYIKEWATPKSPARLQKMAETIAALTRNAKRRRDARMGSAIKDWEQDLEFLYYEYYVGHFRFAWPAVTV
jgi:hypothetical protein